MAKAKPAQEPKKSLGEKLVSAVTELVHPHDTETPSASSESQPVAPPSNETQPDAAKAPVKSAEKKSPVYKSEMGKTKKFDKFKK